ncbi:hypothetical protein VTJ49DRAFT_415 [Mycothermus thermophilus]|uniref:Casein kinase II subunit beta n=1 Tax=Humicola insolens TaxID=85995 RepID=A0ABR3VFM6_HUMIN
MDQLETQVSDLRSFLGTTTAAPQAPDVVQVVSPHDVASPYSPGPLRASSHSSLSAPGDNSAPHQQRQQQQQHHHHHQHEQQHGQQQGHGHQLHVQQQQQQQQQQQHHYHQTHQQHQQQPLRSIQHQHHSLLHHHPQSPPLNGHQHQQPPGAGTIGIIGGGHGGNATAPTNVSAAPTAASITGSNGSPSTPGVGGAGAAKRRAEETEEGPVKQQRSKRNRYISIACNECKRRKIKCNGQTPCQRCGHLNLQCLYAPNCCSNFKDSEEFRQMAEQVKHLQEQVESLVSSMNTLRQETARLAPLHDRVLPPPTSSGATPSPSPSTGHHQQQSRPSLPFRAPSFFSGPTSLSFTVDVAKNTLHNMGYSAAAEGSGDGSDETGAPRETSPNPSPLLAPVRPNPPPPSLADPIWEFDEPEMMHLLRLYQEEIDAMYPVATIGSIVEHIRWLSNWMETTRRTGVAPDPGLDQVVLDPKTLLLKIVMCCALVVAEHGHSEKAVRVYDSIQPIVDKMLMSSPADVTQLSFLGLCAGYRFLSSDEVLAWRTVGQVARLCLELGLHRREGLQKIADPQVRRDALHTFWSAYVLDRRWSFHTGLPFVCHDDKIDPKLPLPEGYPFLTAMIGYSRVAAKIWRLVDYFEPAVIRELKPHDFEERDREILDWYESVPAEVRTDPSAGDQLRLPSGRHDLQRLRIWTWLRLTQVRIWLYTPVLHSATSIAENEPLARKVVEMSKQTIRLLTRLNNETDLYRRMQVFYHQFLTSSIAVLFLASTHAPLQFSAICRDEFYMGLELIKEMSARSWISQRVWRTIRSLRAYAPKLGLEDNTMARRYPQQPGSSTSSGHSPGVPPTQLSGAASSRAGSNGPAVTSPMSVTPGAGQPMQMDDPNNGLRLQSEMSRIYEGYMGGAAGMTTADMGTTETAMVIALNAAAAELGRMEMERAAVTSASDSQPAYLLPQEDGGCGCEHGPREWKKEKQQQHQGQQEEQHQQQPNLDSLPIEILYTIARLLDYPTLLHLSAVSRALRAVVHPDYLLPREDKLAYYHHAEQTFAQHTGKLVCFVCFRFLPPDAFGDSMRTGPKGRYGKDVMKQRARFCWECGVGGRRYRHLKAVKKGGLEYFPCYKCGVARQRGERWYIRVREGFEEEGDKFGVVSELVESGSPPAALLDGAGDDDERVGDGGPSTDITTTAAPSEEERDDPSIPPSQQQQQQQPQATSNPLKITHRRCLPPTITDIHTSLLGFPIIKHTTPSPGLPPSGVRVFTTPSLLSHICSLLPYRDVLTLRITCRYLRRTIPRCPLGTPYSPSDIHGAWSYLTHTLRSMRENRKRLIAEDRQRFGIVYNFWHRPPEARDPSLLRACFGCFRVRYERHFSRLQRTRGGRGLAGDAWRRRCWECLRRMYNVDERLVDWEARKRFERQVLCGGCRTLKWRDDGDECRGCEILGEEGLRRLRRLRGEREEKGWKRSVLGVLGVLDQEEEGLGLDKWFEEDEEDEDYSGAFERLFEDGEAEEEEAEDEWQEAVGRWLEETRLWEPEVDDDRGLDGVSRMFRQWELWDGLEETQKQLEGLERLFMGAEWFYGEEEVDEFA